jgi:hypothetical protein
MAEVPDPTLRKTALNSSIPPSAWCSLAVLAAND